MLGYVAIPFIYFGNPLQCGYVLDPHQHCAWVLATPHPHLYLLLFFIVAVVCFSWEPLYCVWIDILLVLIFIALMFSAAKHGLSDFCTFYTFLFLQIGGFESFVNFKIRMFDFALEL